MPDAGGRRLVLVVLVLQVHHESGVQFQQLFQVAEDDLQLVTGEQVQALAGGGEETLELLGSYYVITTLFYISTSFNQKVSIHFITMKVF